MLGPDSIRDICIRLLSACQQIDPAARAEVWLDAHEEALTRFANNAISQNVLENNVSLTLRALLGRRAGIATTNRVDAAALEHLAEDAIASARLAPEDPALLPPADPQPLTSVQAFDELTAACSPAERARLAQDLFARANDCGLNVAGALSTTAGEMAAANSQGLFAYHPYTLADFSTTARGEDSSGWAEGFHWKLSGLPVADLGRAALQGALDGRGPRPIPAGEYPVILLPPAASDLVVFLGMGANGMEVQEGRSWMSTRLGQPAASPLVSLWDDGLNPTGVPRPFDGEGLPRQKVDIFRAGVVQSPVYDRATGHKAGRPSTGHALPPSMRSWGAIPGNLFLAPGDATVDSMVASMERGLLINRFWYTRFVHYGDCVITGMTRDGAWWVENGQIAYPVKNLRFTQSYVAALAAVSAVGRAPQLISGGWLGNAVSVPALKIDRFRFTS